MGAPAIPSETVPQSFEQPYFTYRPLDRFGDSIRLIELMPEADGGYIDCRLRHESVSSKPRYTAVSYLWGTAQDRVWIKIDGMSFAVQPNLWQFLLVLAMRAKQSDEAPVLWIDAISINQHGIPERNHQVQQMGQIYRNADRVLVWLGP